MKFIKMIFFSILQNFTAHPINVTVVQAVETYIERLRIVYPVLDGRIKLLN